MMLWACLAIAVSSIITTFMSQDMLIDGVAISLSIITIIGIVFSGALVLTEQIIKTCNS